VAKVTEATGIKAVVEAIAPNGGCGCAQRQAMLNKLVPFNNEKQEEPNPTGETVN
jgi:hypothetical protein